MEHRPYVLFLAIVAGGCSFEASCGKKKVDTAEVETTVRERATSMGLEPTKVSCPKDVEAKAGASFTCDVALADGTHPLQVDVVDVNAETKKVNMAFKWKNGPAVAGKAVAADLSKQISGNLGTEATVDCGAELRYLEADKTIKCQLAAGGKTTGLTIKFNDEAEIDAYQTDAPLLSRTKLEGILTPSVREQTKPDVNVTCGETPLLDRPTDGIVWCDISDGHQQAKIRVEIDPELNVKRWEVAQP